MLNVDSVPGGEGYKYPPSEFSQKYSRWAEKNRSTYPHGPRCPGARPLPRAHLPSCPCDHLPLCSDVLSRAHMSVCLVHPWPLIHVSTSLCPLVHVPLSPCPHHHRHYVPARPLSPFLRDSEPPPPRAHVHLSIVLIVHVITCSLWEITVLKPD